MPNKTRNWTDVELIISSVSIALTLGFWGLFASKQNAQAGIQSQASLVPDPSAQSAQPTAGIPSALAPGQVVFFGASTPMAPTPLAVQPQPRHRGGGGGGGTVASSGSSH